MAKTTTIINPNVYQIQQYSSNTSGNIYYPQQTGTGQTWTTTTITQAPLFDYTPYFEDFSEERTLLLEYIDYLESKLKAYET